VVTGASRNSSSESPKPRAIGKVKRCPMRQTSWIPSFAGWLPPAICPNARLPGLFIGRPATSREMLLAAQKFSAMLRTVPLPAGVIDPARGLLTIINSVARFFHAQVVVDEFRAEPPATFIVDSNTPNPLLASLGQALNAGALVYVPDDPSQLILTSLRGKRFRVTYLLAPLYGLPLRLGKEIMLSTIMKHSEQRPAPLPLFLTDDEQ
jgi:hypothetical protein